MIEYLQEFNGLGPHDLMSVPISRSWYGPDPGLDKFCTAMFSRRELLRKFSFAVPTEEALAAILKYSPIVEMGAGAGYWAKLLRDRGADVIAYDICQPADNWWCGGREGWTEITPGDPECLGQHPDRALMLCWPPSSSMAFDSLQSWKGEVLIYIGEFEPNVSGCPRFFRSLGDFEAIQAVVIPQWYGIHDLLTIFRRK